MYNRTRLKPFVLPMIYGIAGLTLLFSTFFIFRVNYSPVEEIDNEPIYIDRDTINHDEQPVIGVSEVIIRPYNDSNVKKIRNFYDYNSEKKDQEQSIIFYEKTYIQNSGIDYGSEEIFDVISILDGMVIKLKEDNLLGKTVEIRHSNDFISVYQCLSEVKVKENATVSQGELVGKSGTCNISKDLGNHLHFELFYKGTVVDPKMFFDKNIKDL